MSVGALDSATISQLKADAANRPDQNLDEVIVVLKSCS